MAGLDDDPVLGVLLSKTAVKAPPSLLCFEVDSPNVFKFQDFPRSALIAAWERRTEDPTYKRALKELGFAFEFRPDVVPSVADVDNFEFKARFFLYNFVAWQFEPVMEHLPLVLDSLFRLLGSKFENQALRAVEHSFQLYFLKTPLDDFQIVFPIFVKFFRAIDPYTHEKIFSKVIDCKDLDKITIYQ